MIYTERSKLAVIECEGDEDCVSFDVLAQAIVERPANIVYCVAKEILYGIISMGDIARAKEEGAESVAINRNFTWIFATEYMKARRIFGEKESINALPVVDENNVLLGDYIRWDDSVIDYIYWGQVCKSWPDIILVYPCNKLKKKQQSFKYFKECLLSSGIMVKCIQRSEIEQYLGSAVYILFTDEMRATYTLYTDIWNKDLKETQFFTYRQICGESRYEFTQGEMNRYLLDLCRKGIYVLNLTFECNANNEEYYKKINRELKEKYNAIGHKCVNKVYPNMYKEFFDDLYTEEYADIITHIEYRVETVSGLRMLKDYKSEFYNVKGGERYTCGQPKDFEKTIYFVGPCYIYGHHTEDKYTIESCLQERINNVGYKIKVVNCGSLYSAQNFIFAWLRIKSLPLRKGDIVVYGDIRFEGIEHLNLLDVCKEHNIPAEWMTNDVRHCNHKINLLYADAIYDALRINLTMRVREQGKVLQDSECLIETMYIERYFKNFISTEHSKTGAIVMNCNPFTYGHRYLIEEALKQTSFLIIFVVEEDRSLFSFDERFDMVCKGVKDLSNVKVVPSGPFILSQTTFPEYFIKVRDEELTENIENDIRIFGEKIAPYLNIKYRFVGEELEDAVTNEYNLAMKRILPEIGIELVEIPRKELNGKLISASLVRNCLEYQELEMVEKLVPESVREIMFKRNY